MGHAGRSAVLVLGVILLVQVAFPVAPAQRGSDGTPAWWNEDWPFRVLVEAEGPTPIPGDLEGEGSTLRARLVDFQDALDAAGWPGAVELPPDPGSIVVVPYASLAPGAEPGEPVARRVFDPATGGTSCEATVEARCQVLWEHVPGTLAYGIYWGPPAWNLTPPETGHPPRPVGHASGHEHWLVAENLDDPRAVIQPPPRDSSAFTVERRSLTGWTDTEQRACGYCELLPGVYRIVTRQPSTVTLYEELSETPLKPRALRLGGTAGPVDDRLVAALPGGDWDADPRVALWPTQDACSSRCSVRVGGQTVDIREGGGTTVSLPQPSQARAITADVSSDERIHAGLVGGGLAPVEARNTAGTDFVVPVGDRFTVVANRSASLAIQSLTTGERIQDDFQVDPGARVVPVDPKHDLLGIRSSVPIDVYAGSGGAGLQHHQPLPPRTPGLLPADARLFAVAPRLGDGSLDLSVSSSGQDGPERRLSIPAGSVRLLEEGGDEPSPLSISTQAPLGLLSVRTSGDEAPLLGQALSVAYPQRVERTSAGYVASVAGLELEPSSRFAGAGATASFDVSVENLARGADGRTPSLSVNLDVEPVGVASDLGVEATLGATSLSLPGRFGATETVPLHVRVPDDVADAVLTFEVVARSDESPRLEAVANARVTVVTIRDFDLTFEDGSASQVRTSEPGGETVFPVVAENTGTVPLDLVASLAAQGDERFSACLSASPDSACESEIAVDGVPAGATREFQLRVDAPDVDEEVRSDVRLTGELASGHGPVRNVDATVLVNVPVAANVRTPETLELPPGASAEFDLVVENLGVQSRARLSTFASGGTVRTSLLEDGEPVNETETLLGPSGTDRAVWETKGLVRVSPNATPGRTTEGRFLLELEPGGGLPPFRNASTVSVQVIRVFDDVEVNGTVDPGVSTPLDVDLSVPDLRNAKVRLRVQEAPPRWSVDAPEAVRFDANGSATPTVTVTPPAGEPPGRGLVRLGVSDPLGPGGEIRVHTRVGAKGVASLQLPESVELAVGDRAVLQAHVENVGNRRLEGRLTTHAEGVNATSLPMALDPLESTSVPLALDASGPHEGEARVVFLDGTREAGASTLEVRAENASLELTSATGSIGGDRVLVTASVANRGTVPVRNLTVGLVHDGILVRERSVNQLPAGQSVPVPLEWVPPGPVESDALSVRLDAPGPDGEGLQEIPVRMEGDAETPGPGVLALGAVLSGLAVALRSRRRAA